MINALSYGRDFGYDQNEANMSPVADAGGNVSGYVGEWIQLNGANSFDPDGQIVQYLWTQIFGTKTGTKYYTSFNIEIDDPTSPTPQVRLMQPGSAGMRLTAVDDKGRSYSNEIDVGVTFREGDNPLKIRGINNFDYFDKTGMDSYVLKELDKIVNNYNANYIEISVSWWMEDIHSTNIHPLGEYYPGCPGTTPNDIEFINIRPHPFSPKTPK